MDVKKTSANTIPKVKIFCLSRAYTACQRQHLLTEVTFSNCHICWGLSYSHTDALILEISSFAHVETITCLLYTREIKTTVTPWNKLWSKFPDVLHSIWRFSEWTLPLLRHFLYTWSTSSLQWPCQGIHHNNLEQTQLSCKLTLLYHSQVK